MVWTYKANLRGPRGAQGADGLPGVNAVANDTATGGYISTTGVSATKTALATRATTTRKQAYTTVTKWNPSPAYRYHVIRVTTGGSFIPGLVEKHYGADYEKTYTTGTFAPPAESIGTYARRTQAPIVVNADAWSSTNGEITGLQIKDGVLYHDFSTTVKGRDALGILADGRFKILEPSLGDTAASALAAGVVDTFTYGPPLVKDGVVRNLTAVMAEWPDMVTLRPRTILGQSSTGDIIMIVVEGDTTESPGIGGQDMAALAFAEGCYQALLVDGGGSSQARVDGGILSQSSDATPRPIVSVMAVHAPRADSTVDRTSEFRALALDPAITSAVGKFRVDQSFGGKRLVLWGSFTGVTASGATLGTLPKYAWPTEWIYKGVPVVVGALALSAELIIKDTGVVMLSRNSTGTYLATDRYDIYIDTVI